MMGLFAAGMWLVAVGAGSAFADALPITFEETEIRQQQTEQQPRRADFFELETVDFDQRRDGRQRRSMQNSGRAMSLTPKGLDRYVDMKRRSLASEHVREAEQYIEEENWAGAAEQIDMALLRYPDDVVLMGKAAIIYAMAGNYDEASTLFRVFLQHYPDQVNHLAAWGGVLLRTGQVDQALDMLLRALELDPDNVAARYQMEIYNQMAANDELWSLWPRLSLKELSSVVSWLVGEHEELVELLGRAGYERMAGVIMGEDAVGNLEQVKPLTGDLLKAQQKQDYGQVMQLSARLIQLGVQNLWVRIVLAQACFENGREKKAEEIMQLMQRLYPEFYPVWYNGGFVALRMGNYAEAARMYKEALAREESGPSMFALACAYAGQGEIDEAWTILKQLKRADPVQLLQWLEGDQEYLNNIKDHPRFYEVGVRSD
jgi:tetratricopeptide (TPR) repeat protein